MLTGFPDKRLRAPEHHAEKKPGISDRARIDVDGNRGK